MGDLRRQQASNLRATSPHLSESPAPVIRSQVCCDKNTRFLSGAPRVIRWIRRDGWSDSPQGVVASDQGVAHIAPKMRENARDRVRFCASARRRGQRRRWTRRAVAAGRSPNVASYARAKTETRVKPHSSATDESVSPARG